MAHQVALNFEDGVTKVIRVGDFETIMDAAYKARINIPSDCRDGACGTCKSFCDSGSFDPGDFVDDAMTEEELDKGYLLTCQALPESDMSVNIAGTSEAAKTSAASFASTVTTLDRHSDSTISFSLDVENRGDLAFLPGQYVNIKVPGTDEVRSYSMSSGPEVDAASFMVRISPQGAMSEYLRDRAEVGDAVEFTGPFGSFFLREPKRPLLLLAGGTGLAPLLSILEKLTQNPPGHPVHLIYGVTREADIVGLDWLRDYESRLPDFTWDLIASEEGTSAPHTGYVTALIGPEHLHDGNVDIYLCGPPPMVNAVSSWMDAEGVSPANFYFERFAPKEKTGGDAETGAPVPSETVAHRGEEISGAEAVSSMETGRLQFGAADTAAHLDARAGLESAIVQLMIGKTTDEQLHNWERLATAVDSTVEHGKVVDAEQFVTTNFAFHEYLFTVAENPVLLEAYRGLDTQRQMSATIWDGSPIFESVARDHHDLVEAFRRQDLAAALEIVQRHTSAAKDTMETAVESAQSGEQQSGGQQDGEQSS